MSFVICVFLNSANAAHSNYTKKIAYLVGEGNPCSAHILNMHAALKEIQRDRFLHLGTIGFDTDDECIPLQGADVIAWIVRKMAEKRPPKHFAPLLEIVKSNHVQRPFEKRVAARISGALNDFLLRHDDGAMHELIQELPSPKGEADERICLEPGAATYKS